MLAEVETVPVLVLGIGNVLLSDDGAGVHVVRVLADMQNRGGIAKAIALRDGGTIGLSLLTDLEDFSAFIAIDATEMHSAPGTVRSFVGPDMDRQLGGNKRSSHEVALADLIGAAHLSGCAPERRALVGIQPASTDWGLAPTEAVAAAFPVAARVALQIVEDWTA